MRFVILAAGEGTRLAGEGYSLPKPLIPLKGEAMLDRLLRIFIANGASEVAVIVNKENRQTQQHLKELRTAVPLHVEVKSTPSSMDSLYELRPFLTQEERFCVTTVDTVFPEERFARYLEAFRQTEADGLMAVTDYVDDEKPLYVQTDNQMRILRFEDRNEHDCRYVSGGIYCLKAQALKTLDRCRKQGVHRMRNYQRQLLADGLSLQAYRFPKIIDMDHIDDIRQAEKFLAEEQ